jgi:hypothetical protein
MSYLNRQGPKKGAPSAELLYLIIVLAAGAATFWYAGHKIGLDLSSIQTAATVLGIGQTATRYDPRASAQTTSGQVVHSVAAVTKEAEAVKPAPSCTAGQTPVFANGLAELKQRLGDTMGNPVECEHPSSPVGDTVQLTSTGLAAYNKVTNTVTFTDGWRHYALRAGDVLTWEGTQSEPPAG